VAGRDAVVEPVEGVAGDPRGGFGGERVADVDSHTEGVRAGVIPLSTAALVLSADCWVVSIVKSEM
jgi:hypothetical protein